MKPHLLKAARQQQGWSQAKVAEAVRVSSKTVFRWEQGQAIPHLYYREQLCTLFGKTAEELGLLSDTHENDIVQQAPLPVAQPATSDMLAEVSLLIDPAVPQPSDGTNSLLGRERLFMQAKHALLAGANLTLTALDGLPGIGKTALAAALSSAPRSSPRPGPTATRSC